MRAEDVRGSYLCSRTCVCALFASMFTAPAETTASAVPKGRIAPRLRSQFRVGPPFSFTHSKLPIFANTTRVSPTIAARVDRGFDLVGDEWIGYKRNYMTLVAAFSFEGVDLAVCNELPFLYHNGTSLEALQSFKLRVVGSCVEDPEDKVDLVQHMAKRDKANVVPPPVYYAAPGELPPHQSMLEMANIRSVRKISWCDRLFFMDDLARLIYASKHRSIIASYPRSEQIAYVARYERVQFSIPCTQKRLAARSKKHYIISVQLLGTSEGKEVVLASTQTPPLTVRGRSPTNYESSDMMVGKVDMINEVAKEEEKVQETKASATDESNFFAIPQNKGGAKGSPKRSPKRIRKKIGKRTPLGKVNESDLNSTRTRAVIHFVTKNCENTNAVPLSSSSSTSSVSSLDTAKGSLIVRLKYCGRPPCSRDFKKTPMPLVGAPREEECRRVECTSEHSRESLEISGSARSGSLGESTESVQPPSNFSTYTKMEQAVREYQAAKASLDELLSPKVDTSIYSNLPVPFAFPSAMSTSTPLQINVNPEKKLNLHYNVLRCTHGLKKKEKEEKLPYTPINRLFHSTDLHSGNYDSSYLTFKNRMEDMKKLIFFSEDPLSPLTVFDMELEEESFDWGQVM